MIRLTPPVEPLRYHNITISGLPGAGSTTMLKHLKEALSVSGWRGFSGGEFMRSYAVEKGLFNQANSTHHDATVYSEEFDREVDLGMREKLASQKNWILESWLSGFMAQGVPGVLKVLMVCSNKAVRVDRIVNRDSITPEDAIAHMNERYAKNLAKWQRMYKQEWHDWVVESGLLTKRDVIDFWHSALYDVVIDTYSLNQQEAAQVVLDALSAHVQDKPSQPQRQT